MRFIREIEKKDKNGGKNGDLYIKINIEDGKKYSLSGTDLYTTIPITGSPLSSITLPVKLPPVAS